MLHRQTSELMLKWLWIERTFWIALVGSWSRMDFINFFYKWP